MRNRIAHLFPIPAMPRPSHPKSQLATTIDPSLHEAVREFSEMTDIPIAQMVEDALRRYLRANYFSCEDGEFHI